MDINATVLDASAILASVNQEAGYETVERCLQGEAHCNAANWSEVKRKIAGSRSGLNWLETWLEIESLLVEYHGLIIESVSREDAERAAERWEVNKSLSLADRLCPALGDRPGLPAVTADQAWGDGDMIIQIR